MGAFRMSAFKRVSAAFVCCAASMALAFSLAAHLQAHFWFAHLLAQFQIWALVGSLVFLASSLAIRSRGAALLSLLLLLSSSATLAPLLWHEMKAPEAEGASVRIINYNVLSYSAHQEKIAAWIREQQPDVVALVEANYRWTDTIAGLKDILPYETHIDHRGNLGMVLLSRYPLQMIRHSNDIPRTYPTIEADIALPIGKVRFIIAHDSTPVTPRDRQLQDRHIADYTARVRRSNLPVVLMGDFNTAPWTSAYFAMVTEQNLYGSVLSASWPSNLVPFGVPIDQIVAGKGAVVTPLATGPAHDSDHRARVADLRLKAN